MIPKFRAYHEIFGMSDVFTLLTGDIVFSNPKDGGMSSALNRNDVGFDKIMTECKIMQFTGLKDKNGKEIFEGDIIRFGQCEEIVIFDDGCFRLQSDGNELSHYNKRCMVVGDIHANPELIDGVES